MIELIPRPQKIHESSGTFDLSDKSIKVNADSTELDIFAELIPGLEWELDQKLPVFSLQIGTASANFPFSPLKQESYYLRVSQDGVCAQAGDTPGLYYAVQTLSQLQRNASLPTPTSIPCCEITDYPNFPLRIYHDDISRGQISTLEDFRRILHNISRYKINAYIPYIEDMLYLSDFPDIGEGRGRLTHEEVREIHAEAKRHHIRVIPAFCLLGHCENMLALPQYGHLGRKVPFLPSSFDVNNPDLKPFLSKVIAEVATLFEDEFIHGGFDEVRGLSCKEFCDHIEWVASELRKYGKRLVVYYDMFINHFGHEAAEKLSDDVVFANWNYNDLTDFPAEKELASSKHEHWILTGLNNSCQLTFNLEKAGTNIRNFVKQGKECGATAAILTGWGNNGYENQRDINWNLVAYFAEQAWSGNKIDFKNFLMRFHNDFYGAPFPELANVLFKISDPQFAGISGWKLWRATLWGMERIAEINPELVKICHEMVSDLSQYERVLDEVQNQVLREKSHIDHYRLCLKRVASIVSRVLAAEKSCELRRKGVNEDGTNILDKEQSGCPVLIPSWRDSLSALCRDEKIKLDELGRFYHDLWLRHNKPENLERSYSWYEKLGNDYQNPSPEEKGNGEIINLDDYYNESPLEICGIPKGKIVYDNTLFHISEFSNFSIAIEPGQKIILSLDKPIKTDNLHFLLAGSNIPYEDTEVMQIDVLNNNNILFQENLLARKHLPDWYAPRGDMWAGSGNLFLDPSRVKMVWDGAGLTAGRAPLFGLFKLDMSLKGSNTHIANQITIKNIATEAIVHIVGLTV